MTPTPIFLDTDIGDDIDDLLALAIACASPEIELRGVGTVFGPTVRRTQVARSVLVLAGISTPVHAGLADPLTPSSRRPEFAEKIERRFHPIEGIKLHVDFGLPESELPAVSDVDAPSAISAFWGGTEMQGRTVAVGPLSNLASALLDSSQRPPMTVMAGQFEGLDWAEWNVLCDPDAAAIVFQSGAPIDVIPFRIGVDLSFTSEEIKGFTTLGTPLSDLFRDAIALWQGQGFGFHVWDLLAVLAAGRPELFEWRAGTVHVEAGSSQHGHTSFEPRQDGLHRIAVGAERGAIVPLMIERLAEAATNCRRVPQDR
ncbi:MAG TPA: nucleoside hydrolase [Fimbriimonadaceae bacterium]|mgnify:CR=1 FL=1|nr:nucleoside hydrolase [Fimbriimonadaceae bacterium]